MTEEENTPNTAQITMWRNLLDAFGQLSAAWSAAHDAQELAHAGEGPGSLTIPSDLIVAFARAGESGAESLAGLAGVLAHQHESGHEFDEVEQTQRRAWEQWTAAHGSMST
ncbi:MAG: hypothetical protein ACRDQW_04210 [Haloechinothrix sp.]